MYVCTYVRTYVRTHTYLHIICMHACMKKMETSGRKGVDSVEVCVIELLHLLTLGKCYTVHINASSL